MPIEWSEDARAELAGWLIERLPGDGVAVSAERERARSLVEAELVGAPRPVQPADLRHAISRARLRHAALRSGRGGFLAALLESCLFFVVGLMPFISLLVELILRLSRDVAFDPLPSVAHVLLVCSVPVIAMFSWSATHAGPLRAVSSRIAFAHGVALAVAGVYCVAYVPHLPIAIFGIVLFGLGFAAVEPVVCFPTLLFLAARMTRGSLTPERTRKDLWLGAACGLALFALVEVLSLASGGATYTGRPAAKVLP